MANGKIIYYPDGVTPVEYAFAVNYAWDSQYPGRVDLVSRKRALDGTTYTDKGPLKQIFILNFAYVTIEQLQAFQAAYDSGYAVDLYLDADEPLTAQVQFESPIDPKPEPYFRSSVYTWSFTAEFSEI